MSFQPINLPVGTSPIPGVTSKKSINLNSVSVTPTPDIPEDFNRDSVLYDNNLGKYSPIQNGAVSIDPVLEKLSPSTNTNLYSFPNELHFQDDLSRFPFVEITAYDVNEAGFESLYNQINSNTNTSSPDTLVAAENFKNAESYAAKSVYALNFAASVASQALVSAGTQVLITLPVLMENTRLRNKKLTPLVKMRLPAPPNLESNYSLNYSDNEGVGSARKAAEVINSAMSGTVGVPNYIIKQGTASLINGIVSSILATTSGVSDSILSGTPDVEGYIRFQSRTIPIPMVEYTFEGIDRRKFNFTWKMYAKSSKEATEIYNIIYNLKKYSHPSALLHQDSSGGTSSLDKFYIRYPKIFTLKHLYLNGNKIVENLYINRIKPCVITSIKVNYTDSNSLVLFNESITINGNENYRSPIGLELSISLTELELLFAEDFDINSKAADLFTEGGY
jgi:hypothetical protein